MKTKYIPLLAILLLIWLLALGCSGAGGAVTPDLAGSDNTDIKIAEGSHYTWGLWQWVIDPQNETLDIIQLRTGNFHLNALPFLEPPVLSMLTLETLKFDGNLVEADVGLRHPFTGLKEFTGFDVHGIVITNGSVTGFNDPDIRMAGPGDTRLLNPDGFTRWWNPAEFPLNNGTIYSYTDGLLGTADAVGNYNCTINAYKSYSDDLTDVDMPLNEMDPMSRCVFSAGQKNIRHYTIEIGDDGLILNYAVDACWHYPVGDPPWNVPESFSSDANSIEAWNLSTTIVENSLYNVDTGNGGDLSLQFDVWDHYNSELNKIRVESPGNFPMTEVSSPSSGGDGYSTYEVNIPDATPGPDMIDLLVTVESEDQGYQGLVPGAMLSSYFVLHLPVACIAPMQLQIQVPNGGESWQVGSDEEIIWLSSDVPGTVYIEYSKDNFVSDIHTIATDEENDGSYLWENIPDDQSDTVRVRITSTLDPLIFDISDDDFSIVDYGDLEGWARTWGSPDYDLAYTPAIDSAGNIYVLGIFFDTTDFDPGEGEDIHTTNGEYDCYLSKFNADGDHLWAVTWGGTGIDIGTDLTLDDAGNVIVTGTFAGQVDFDPGPGQEIRTSKGSDDIFISKFDPDGSLIWVDAFGGKYVDGGFGWWAPGVATDEFGSIYITGGFRDEVDFDPGPGETKLKAVGYADVFLAAYDSSGGFLWARAWGYYQIEYGEDLTVDSMGYIYVTGLFEGEIDFDPGPNEDKHESAGYLDCFLAKYDTDGNYYWVKTWGGEQIEVPRGVALDSMGGLYITGQFEATVDFDPGPGVDEHTAHGSDPENEEVFILKLDTDGDFHWAATWGSDYYDIGWDVAVDIHDDVYVVGYYQFTVDFNPGPGVNEYTSNGDCDIFMSKFSPDGNYLWTRSWGSAEEDIAYGVECNPEGFVYVAGSFEDSFDFNAGPGIDIHTSNGLADAFLMKLLPNGYF